MINKKKLMFSIALSALLSNAVLAEPQALPERVPFNGVFPVVEGAGSLTVSGEGIWLRSSFQNGERPYLSAYDDSGQVLPDGHYQFEFKSIPEPLESSTLGLTAKSNTSGEVVRGQFRVSGAEIIFE